jgi:hypothetical protein
MKGGKADKLTLPKIAKKHKVSIVDLTSQLKLGIKTEMEHTDSRKQAKEIAMDHLAENPKYYTKLKKTKLEEINFKNLATGALIAGASLLGKPSVGKAQQPTAVVQQQPQKVLSTVSISRAEPLAGTTIYPTGEKVKHPNLDDVHGALGSKKPYMQDNFSNRVSAELMKQYNNGKKPDVSNIKVETSIEGNKIVTKASCDIIESQDGIAYTHFTTRGSIGTGYDTRHDGQINGLTGRLENLYGGVAKQVGDTLNIGFEYINGDTVRYRQSFFVASDSKQGNQQQQQIRPDTTKQQQQIKPDTTQQTQSVLQKINFEHSESVSDYIVDYIQGSLGSTKMSNDFSDKIQAELFKQYNQGKKPDVTNIQVKTEVVGDKIVTKASCDIVESKNGIAYVHFKGVGAIGTNYQSRHKQLVNDEISNLKAFYSGDVKQVGKTFSVKINVKGKNIEYLQSFFVSSDNRLKENLSETKDILTETKLGYFIDVKTDFQDADFWVIRRGSENKIGKPVREFNPEHFGIKVTATDKIDPNYLFYVFEFMFNKGYFLDKMHGTTKLQNITINDIKNIQLNLTESLKEESLPKKLNTDIEIEYHKSLNPKIWLNNHLKSNIRKNLLNLAKFYFKQLDLGVELKDIIFTGSLVNYNYTNLSDIDLHLVIDYKELTDDEDFAKEFFGDKRAIWADSNEIQIFGYPVEIYVQDETQLDDKGMGAMYSILKNKWIKKPKYKIPDVDRHLITQKVNKYLDILNKISMMDDSIKKVDAYNKVFEKIRDKRRKATKEEGEFSVDNLVFKVLRNKKVFDIVKDNKKEIVNNIFSINSN